METLEKLLKQGYKPLPITSGDGALQHYINLIISKGIIYDKQRGLIVKEYEIQRR